MAMAPATTKRRRAVFADVPTTELQKADRLLTGILSDILLFSKAGPTDEIAQFEALYSEALGRVLKSQVAEFAKIDITAEIAEVMQYAGSVFGEKMAAKLEPEMNRYLTNAFRVGQAVRYVPEKIQTKFDLPHQNAVDWLVKHDQFWVGKVFPEKLSPQFKDIITGGVKEGLGRKDIGVQLQKYMLGEKGVGGKQYLYDRVAATTTSRSRNWGSMYSLQEAGFEEYQIQAVMDERTSDICREMDGKVFKVALAMNTIQKALDSAPAEIEQLAPFPKWDAKRKDFYIAPKGKPLYLSGKSDKWLQGNGLSLPPYHPNCRTTYIVTTVQYQEVETGRPPFDVSELKETPMQLDGMHTKAVYQDKAGQKWLFKPVGTGDEFRAWGDHAAAELAKKLGIETPDFYVTTIGGKHGSLQRMYDVAGNFRGVAASALTKQELAIIQREHIFDWLISNHDGHAGNLVRTVDGRVVGIDKGQLFKFFGKDRLSYKYNPNPKNSFYNKAFDAYAKGGDVKLAGLDSPGIKKLLNAVGKLDDDEFVSILTPYAQRAAKQGRLAYGTRDAFLRKALERKHNLRGDFKKFYAGLEKERNKVLGVVKEVKALRPIDAAFVKKMKASGTMGQSVLVAGEDFENMNLLAYYVEGDGMFVEGKLRAQAQSKLLQRLTMDAGIVAKEPYWDDVLKLGKSFNHHLGPGGDGIVPDHTTKLWKSLQKQLAKDKSAAAKYYLKQVNSLAKKSGKFDPLHILAEEEVVWSKAQVGKHIKEYVPSAKGIVPGRGTKFTVEEGHGWDYSKQAKDGKVTFKKGKKNFKGTAYDVDLGGGVKLHYIQHGDKNDYSKQGRFRLELKNATPKQLNNALDKMKDLGMNSTLATAEDIEYLYLSKVSYAAGVLDDVPITPGMTIKRKASEFRKFWEKKLGVDDLKKLKDYNPVPRFDLDSGWARWKRFDIPEDKFAKQMKDYILGHSTYGDVDKSIENILDSGGSLMATEEKFRVGIPIRGMSPVRDQESGGAGYVFTRIADAKKRKKYSLVFDKRLLLDPDSISYSSDMYGRVKPSTVGKERKRTIAQWKKCAKNTTNETIVRNNLSLLQYLEQVNVKSQAQKRRVLKSFSNRGITEIHGRKIEDLVKVSK